MSRDPWIGKWWSYLFSSWGHQSVFILLRSTTSVEQNDLFSWLNKHSWSLPYHTSGGMTASTSTTAERLSHLKTSICRRSRRRSVGWCWCRLSRTWCWNRTRPSESRRLSGVYCRCQLPAKHVRPSVLFLDTDSFLASLFFVAKVGNYQVVCKVQGNHAPPPQPVKMVIKSGLHVMFLSPTEYDIHYKIPWRPPLRNFPRLNTCWRWCHYIVLHSNHQDTPKNVFCFFYFFFHDEMIYYRILHSY